MVRRLGVPALANVDLAFVRPLEGLRGKQPEGRPDTRRRGDGQHARDAATRPVEALARHKACGGVACGGIGVRRVADGAKDQFVVGRVVGVRGGGGVVLQFVVAPAVVAVADFVVPVFADLAARVQGRLPVVGRIAGLGLLGAVLGGWLVRWWGVRRRGVWWG